MQIRWRAHVLALVTYSLWALALTWPLVTAITTHVPGNGADDPPLTWNLWWARTSLLELQANPFDCHYLFHPIGINLAFYTLTLLNGFLSIPLQAFPGLVAASNLLLLSSFVLSGYGTFLLVGYLLRAGGRQTAAGAATWPKHTVPVAAFCSGLLYAFASSKLFYAALGQWNIASSQWIPFYLLYLFRSGDSSRRRYPLLAGLFLVLQAYAELTYASFLVLFTILWLAWRAWLARAPHFRRDIAGPAWSTLLIAAITAIGLAPILANMIPDMLAEGNILAEGGGFADVFSADLLGFFIPTSLHPWLGSLVTKLGFPHEVGQHLYLGYAVLALGAVGAIYWGRSRAPASRPTPAATGAPAAGPLQTEGHTRPAPSLAQLARFWSLSALVWFLLALGPTLRVNGTDSGIPLPFRLLEHLPFFKGNRYPSRYSVLLTLSLAVLVGLGVMAIRELSRDQSNRRRRRALHWAAPLLILTIAFEHLSIPLPLSDMRVPPVYQEIASAMPAGSALLDIPVAWRNGSRVTGTLDTIIMFEQYYQSVHEKAILAGNTSRNPQLKFQYFAEAPVISTLIALETGHDVPAETAAHDRLLAPDVLRFFDIGAIVVHQEQAGPALIPYLESTMPIARFYDDAENIAGYWVELGPWPSSWTITPGGELSRLSYAEGWGIPSGGWIWAQRKEARLLVPMNGMAQAMTFRAMAPRSGQVLTIEVNGRRVGSVELLPGSESYSVDIPLDLVEEGLNEVVLRFGRPARAGTVDSPSLGIGRTGVDAPVSITVLSAGNEVGDFGLIYVDGEQVSPNERGYNIIVLDERTGAVLSATSFDTHLDPGASQALAQHLQQIPAGRVVVVAAADEASRLLGEDAVAALQGVGAGRDLRNGFRWGHAIVGVKGAAPGTAAEAADWVRPVSIAVGTGATEPELSAAFGSMQFRATLP